MAKKRTRKKSTKSRVKIKSKRAKKHLKTTEIKTTRSRRKIDLSRTIENKLKRMIKHKPVEKKVLKSPIKELNLHPKDTRDKLVIFDTNFLMIPGELKVDVFEQAKSLILAKKLGMMIFDKTIYELQKIAGSNGKSKLYASIALGLINNKKLGIIVSKDDSYVDDMILNYKEYLPDFQGQVIIATQDKGLQQKLQRNKVKVLYLAGKKKLALK